MDSLQNHYHIYQSSNKLIEDATQSSRHLNVTKNNVRYKRRNITLKMIADKEK